MYGCVGQRSQTISQATINLQPTPPHTHRGAPHQSVSPPTRVPCRVSVTLHPSRPVPFECVCLYVSPPSPSQTPRRPPPRPPPHAPPGPPEPERKTPPSPLPVRSPHQQPHQQSHLHVQQDASLDGAHMCLVCCPFALGGVRGCRWGAAAAAAGEWVRLSWSPVSVAGMMKARAVVPFSMVLSRANGKGGRSHDTLNAFVRP